MEEAAGGPEEGEHSQDAEVSPALIAVHPHEKSVVIAIGSELRVFDLEYVLHEASRLFAELPAVIFCFYQSSVYSKVHSMNYLNFNYLRV